MHFSPPYSDAVHGWQRIRWTAVVLLFPLLLGACSTTRHRERADREAYGIIETKSPAVAGMEEEFSIDRDTKWRPLAGLPVVETPDESFGDEAAYELGAPIVSMEKALEIAVRNNRSYQNRKEQLYLRALQLTLERHRYTPIFDAGASADYVRSTADVTRSSNFADIVGSAGAVIDQFEAVTGNTATLLQEYHALVESAGTELGFSDARLEIAEERSVTGSSSVGMDLLLKGGGSLAIGITSNFLRFLTGDPMSATSSVLSGAFTQPLLRGRGRDIASERLTQAERDVLYELREYTRFRKEFAVQIATTYYNILQNRDIVRNNWRSLQNFRRSAERERAFYDEGRRKQAELARIQQAELDNENRWINAVRQYRESLDEFKIDLGLSADEQIVLDDDELLVLATTGLRHPSLTAEEAAEIALSTRLDLYTAVDRVDDAIRQVKVATNALKTDLDLVVTAAVPSDGRDNFQELDFRRATVSGGFDLDLPLDRKAERNAFRAALISQERSIRDAELAADNVKLDVRDAWRTLDQARRNFEIAQQSVALSERRVEEQNLLAELGRATALDQVDAQNDLNQAQNDLTGALIAHTLARLNFWRDMGILYIKSNGQWAEIDDGVTVIENTATG